MSCYPKKLTAAQVCAIRSDSRSQRTVAADYGVNGAMIWKIRNGRSWKRLPAAANK